MLIFTGDCTMSPFAAISVLITVMPPNTRFAPKASDSVSTCRTPFRIGRIALSGPIAGLIASMALSRS